MSSDSDPIMAAAKKPDTLFALVLDIFGRLQYKHAVLLFIVYIAISIDLFDDYVMNRFNGAILNGSLTGYGMIIKGVLLILAYLGIDMLVKLNIAL